MESAVSCGCIICLTCPPWVPYLMCACVLLPSGRLGPARAGVGLGFALLGWFRRFRPSPPSAGLVPLSVGLRFSFSCLFRVCPFRARCVVLVFSLSLFFCVPLFASWLGNVHCHLTFIVISSAPLRRGVCVFHLYRCKTSIMCRGQRDLQMWPLPTKLHTA